MDTETILVIPIALGFILSLVGYMISVYEQSAGATTSWGDMIEALGLAFIFYLVVIPALVIIGIPTLLAYITKRLKEYTPAQQTITLTVTFKVQHNPGTPEHLHAVAETYLQGKGVTIEDGEIII